jgi:hypothetical protein
MGQGDHGVMRHRLMKVLKSDAGDGNGQAILRRFYGLGGVEQPIANEAPAVQARGSNVIDMRRWARERSRLYRDPRES